MINVCSLLHHVIQAERTSGSYIVDDLYNEFHWFKYGKTGFNKCIGHFSQVKPTTQSDSCMSFHQIIWKDTKKIGVGISEVPYNNSGKWGPNGRWEGQATLSTASEENSIHIKSIPMNVKKRYHH